MLKKYISVILALAVILALTLCPVSVSAVDDEHEHQWEWQGSDDCHWQYCPGCGVRTRTLEHEKGDVKAETEIVTEPIIFNDEEEDVFLVTVYGECPTCLHHSPIKAYVVSHSFELDLYKPAQRRRAVITKSANAISIDGTYTNEEMVFWDGVQLRKNSDGYYDHPQYTKEQGSVIIHFDGEFLAQTDDGEYELLILNGKEYTVMTVTVENHFLVGISEKDFGDYPEISAYDGITRIKDYENHNAKIIPINLDDILPLLGDADSDGEVSITDASLMQRKLADMTVGIFDISVTDTDSDGFLGVTDITLIQRWLADFPCRYPLSKPTPGYEVQLDQ